jgi:hypothetical protein
LKYEIGKEGIWGWGRVNKNVGYGSDWEVILKCGGDRGWRWRRFGSKRWLEM